MARIDEVTDDHADDAGSMQLPPVSAFSAAVSDTDYASAVVTLAQLCSSDLQPPSWTAQYQSQLSELLDSGSAADVISVFSFISALSIVHPPTANSLVLASEGPDLLESCFDAVELFKGGEADQTQLVLGSMLVSLVDYPQSRSELASARPRAERVQRWATSAITAGSLVKASVQRSQTGLYATLLLLKLAAPTPSSSDLPGDSQQAAAGRERATKSGPAAFSLAKQEVIRIADALPIQLTRLARTTLLAALETLAYLSILTVHSSASTDFRDQISTDTALLKALTQMANMAGRPVQAGSSGIGALKRPVFPNRTGAGKQDASLYSFDPTVSTTGSELGHDVAIQYGLAAVFQHVCAYPPQLSAEQRQLDRLRRVAAQKQRQAELKAGGESSSSQKDGQRAAESEDLEEDYRAQFKSSETRCRRLLEAGLVSALVCLTNSEAFSRHASHAGARPVSRLREAIAATFSALTIKQDQRIRGTIAQHGGATALLKISEQELERYRRNAEQRDASTESPVESRTNAEISLVPLQALARMCISLDPSLLFGSAGKGGPIVAVPALCTLFLHPSAEADGLARFEAALALTNLASVGAETSSRICKFRLAMLIDGPPREATSDRSSRDSMLEVLSARVFAEDNALRRRAYIELICNLVQCEDAFKFWSGEEEDDLSQAHPTTDDHGRPAERAAQGRLHILAAFCSPAVMETEAESRGDDKPRQVSLSTRLAAAGTLASLCSSPSACDRVLHLNKRSLNTLARLIAPVRPRESESSSSRIQDGTVESVSEVGVTESDEEDDERTAVDHDAGSGLDERGWEMSESEEVELLEAEDGDVESGGDEARAELGVRGATVAHCLIQYLCWRKERAGVEAVRTMASRLWVSGMVDGLSEAVVGGMAELRVGAGEGGGRGGASRLKREVIRLCVEGLKAWSGLGLGLGLGVV